MSRRYRSYDVIPDLTVVDKEHKRPLGTLFMMGPHTRDSYIPAEYEVAVVIVSATFN